MLRLKSAKSAARSASGSYGETSQAALLSLLLADKNLRGQFDTTQSYSAGDIVYMVINGRVCMREARTSIAAGTAFDEKMWFEPTLNTNPKATMWQGTVMLYNKFVIDGCNITGTEKTRKLTVSRTGTYNAKTMSKCRINGRVVCVSDKQTDVAVPAGGAKEAKYTVYVGAESDGSYGIKLVEAAKVPEGALVLYDITVPAGDATTDTAKCTFTDRRRIEPNYSMVYTQKPYSVVSLAESIPNSPDYNVTCTVEDASDVDAVGNVRVYDKTANGFKVTTSGSADNVRIRWTLIDPNANQ